ncbi:hypothetical protein BpHYR1_031306 [Brachionus plicatilis]|uniref:Uncharacterized protein n=1 Tax=Brachionus plicatilis TaxID=10195 RepID=A0A3M7T6S3_BRAPC|nr:hypothetical protein BpHYR1_031306 [Brachionus plicatilis]
MNISVLDRKNVSSQIGMKKSSWVSRAEMFMSFSTSLIDALISFGSHKSKHDEMISFLIYQMLKRSVSSDVLIEFKLNNRKKNLPHYQGPFFG